MQIPHFKISTKPKYEIFDPQMDFFHLYKRIDAVFDICFLFESLGGDFASYNNRYSLIGFAPDHIIKAKGKSLIIDRKSYRVQNPYATLREIFPQNLMCQRFAGGLSGYMSYEAANYFEPSLKLKSHKGFEDFHFGYYTDGFLHDNLTGEISYFNHLKSRLGEISAMLKRKSAAEKLPKVKNLGPNLSKDKHAQAVMSVFSEIKKGNTFQCEVGLKVKYNITGSVLPIYEALRKANPSPYMYYIKFGERKLLGSSPELLFSLKDRQMQTFPLAGTAKRGKDVKEDLQLAKHLLGDPKELAEHKMLVDLHRNDLGRVSRFGTVCVRRFMDIKKFSHVQHISSEITGIIKPGEDQFSGLARCFPAGTLTGAPKVESMKIIARNEPEARGPYGGAVGFFGFNGDCELAIPIRSLFIYGEKAYTQACGGIVLDSKPEKEYQELQHKLASLNSILKKFIV